MNPDLLIMIIIYFFNALYALIFIRIVLSWLRMRSDNPLSRYVIMLTEPLLAPARKLVRRSPLGGPGVPLDISPLIVFFVLSIISASIISVIEAVYYL